MDCDFVQNLVRLLRTRHHRVAVSAYAEHKPDLCGKERDIPQSTAHNVQFTSIIIATYIGPVFHRMVFLRTPCCRCWSHSPDIGHDGDLQRDLPSDRTNTQREARVDGQKPAVLRMV